MNNIDQGYVKLFTHHSKSAATDINNGNFEQKILDNADDVLNAVDGIIITEINAQVASSQSNSNAQVQAMAMGKSLTRTLSKPGAPSLENYTDPMIYGGNDMSTNQYHENAFIDIVTLLAMIALIAVVAMVSVMVFPKLP